MCGFEREKTQNIMRMMRSKVFALITLAMNLVPSLARGQLVTLTDTVSTQLKPEESVLAIGLGFMDNSELPGDFILPIEYGWNRKNSIGGALGILPFNPRKSSTSSLISLSGTLESRRYFALRGKRLLSGIFVGLCGQFNWARFGYSRITNVTLDVSWAGVGLTLGYQGRIGHKLLIGFKMEAIYPGTIQYKSVDPQGRVVFMDF
jgi:hypothetical protein